MAMLIWRSLNSFAGLSGPAPQKLPFMVKFAIWPTL